MGIEAATLLPFLRLNFGLPSLLSWDHSWDSYQKYEIRQRQIDLVWGCRDDIDLYVKLWLLWDGKAGTGRDEWATGAGLNVQSFPLLEHRRAAVKSWSGRWDSNPRRPAWETELGLKIQTIASTACF